jgi:hypothetical protein
MRSKYLFLLLAFLLVNSVFAESKINREAYKELRDGLHYKKKEAGSKEEFYENWSDEYFKKKKSKDLLNSKSREQDFLKDKNRSSSTPKISEWNLPAWSFYLVYLIVGIVLIVVIYLLFFKNTIRKNKKIEIKIEEELAIEKPFNELESLLSKSIQEGNYREAVRIYFIFIIKTLREKGWINWEKKKTNTAYLFELREKKQFSSFSQITLIFEIVWYGNREIDINQFNQIKPQFEELLKSIQSNHE